ncbi:hypothetical protein D3C73_1508910 [compost metagenome]
MPINPSAVRSKGSAWFMASFSPPGPKPKPPRLVTIRAFLPFTSGSYWAMPLSSEWLKVRPRRTIWSIQALRPLGTLKLCMGVEITSPSCSSNSATN